MNMSSGKTKESGITELVCAHCCGPISIRDDFEVVHVKNIQNVRKTFFYHKNRKECLEASKAVSILNA